jgi:hypothetical protein
MDNSAFSYFDVSTTSPHSVQQVLDFNETIAQLIFNEEKSDIPVHLDLDNHSLEKIQELKGITVQEFREQLISSVAKIHKKQDPLKIFAEFSIATKRWTNSGDPLSTPPALSLLAVLSIAADEMVATENVSSRNYYLRLSEVLGSSGVNAPDKERLAAQYREHAVALWVSLKTWLEAWQGDRGLSTVPLPGLADNGDQNKYVRMPISQALLRESDRANLFKMFAANNLDPAMRISDELMYLLIDQWAMSPYSTHQLQELWRDEELRESLTFMVLAALENWPGAEVETNSDTATRSKVGLTLVLDKWMHRAEFGVEVRYSGTVSPTGLSIRTSDNNFVESMVYPAGPRTVRVADLSAFETNSLVEGILDLTHEPIGLKGQRSPRAIVPMVYRQASNEFIEVSSMTMGSLHGLLIRNSVKNGFGDTIDLIDEVSNLLEDVARPGWSLVDTSKYVGFPDGWSLVQNVDIVVPFDIESLKDRSLEVLVPLEGPSIQLLNGFRVPGRKERWLCSAAPEISAVVPQDTAVKISITDSSGLTVLESQETPRMAFLKLSESNLPPGAYLATVNTGDNNNFGLRFSLVDADTPNVMALRSTATLGHSLEDVASGGNLTASEFDRNHLAPLLRGLHHQGMESVSSLETNAPIGTSKSWKSQQEIEKRKLSAKISIIQADKRACVSSGAHTLRYPTYYGKVKSGMIEGVCKYCGHTRKSPARGRLKKELRASHTTRSITVDQPKDLAPLVRMLPPIEVQDLGAWDQVFNTLCFLRRGSVTDLEAVSTRVSGGSVGVERLVRYLSSLGHIDVKMNDRMRPVEWSISPAVVVATSPSRAHLAGFRSPRVLNTIKNQVEKNGGEVSLIDNPHAPATVALTFPNEVDFEHIFSDVIDPITNQQIVVSKDSCRTILKNCAPISQVVATSPKVSRPNFSVVNRWNPESASWVRHESNHEVGAFQHIGHGYSYTFNESEIGLGDSTTSGSASTVKHNMSRIAGIPLVFYSPESQTLIARLGAELPPIMNRAVVALSGRIPDEDEQDFYVKYHNVPQDVADFVYHLLTS